MSKGVVVQDLYKSFPSGTSRLQILRGLNLEVEPGKMVAITGVSGSGKSTLLHILGGMEAPDAGQVLFDGVDIFTLSREALASFRNRTVGFVFQFHHLLPEFTAQENVMFPYLIRGEDATRAREKASQLLALVGLAERLQHKPGELSGGEQQRVAIARALLADPRVVLADEPTGNLDPHTGEAIHHLLRRLHDERALTTVVVTHNEELAGHCDAGYRLVEGKLEQKT
ncbi:MAG: ABC transporter ATP-binding protein [Acidobacteria bacterium]|nr:ABC transporter ATP-binding protein [Acidobacteriota bacterium]